MAWRNSTEQIADLAGAPAQGRRWCWPGPRCSSKCAFATPRVVLEVLLTFLMAFFMIEARVRMRRLLLLDRASISAPASRLRG